MQSYVAEVGEVVRAYRRDEEEIDALQERASLVLKDFFGQRSWIRFYPYIRVLAKAAYYLCTTLAGVQTLGEEYVNLFQLQFSHGAPRFGARLLFIFLHVLSPILLQLTLQRAESLIAHPSTSHFMGIALRRNVKARRSFLATTDWIRIITKDWKHWGKREAITVGGRGGKVWSTPNPRYGVGPKASLWQYKLEDKEGRGRLSEIEVLENAHYFCTDIIHESVGVPQLHRVHLAFFYISGIYYNISRRITGITYNSFNPQTDVQALKIYKFLGYLTLMQSLLSVTLWISSVESERSIQAVSERLSVSPAQPDAYEVDDGFPHPWFRCSVCLERRSPSSTSCGHIFCWRCIQEHVSSSADEARCPYCRSPVEPSQIVPLLNL